MPSVCFCPRGVSHYHAFSLLQPFKFFRFPSLLLRCRRHARHHSLAPPRMPSPKKKGTKKLVKKFAPPLEVSSSSQESQEPSQVWPPKTPSYLGPPTPMPSSSSAAYQERPDLFAEDVEIDPVGSPYSKQIATPGCSLEPSAVVTVDKPRIQVAAAAEDDGNSDDPAMQQSGQDLSVLEKDWSEHSEEQTQEHDDDNASTDEGEAAGTRAKNISLTRKKEAEIVEWLQDNPFLYGKTKPISPGPWSSRPRSWG